MSKLKSTIFILIVGCLHFAGMLTLIADRLSRASCNIGPQAMCVTPASRVFEAILSFPLFTAIHLLGWDGYFQSLIHALVLNSLVAAAFIWFVTFCVLHWWRGSRNRA